MHSFYAYKTTKLALKRTKTPVTLIFGPVFSADRVLLFLHFFEGTAACAKPHPEAANGIMVVERNSYLKCEIREKEVKRGGN